jgi:hypothetical protein
MGDRESDPAGRIQALVDAIAIEALELPPEERRAFIGDTTRNLREHFLAKFIEEEKRQKAEAFASKLEEWTLEALSNLEASGKTTGRPEAPPR